jgi:hypothetical protein
MQPGSRARVLAAAALVTLVAGCMQPNVTPTPTGAVASPNASPEDSVAPSIAPSPTTAGPVSFPLAVVTGLTSLKANVGLDELGTLASAGKLVVPCDVQIVKPTMTPTTACTPADQIAAAIKADQTRIALLPPGLVEPATKVLAIKGDGPFGLFGPDLFGDAQSRSLDYPVTGQTVAATPLDPAWTSYDSGQVWTMTETGSLCADRGAAHQAVTLGKGWDWVFNGGTARYKGKPFPNPNPPPGITRYPIVAPVQTGNDGVTASISRRADVALVNHKCPILPTKDWSANDNTSALSFSVPEDVVSRWQKFLGVDAVYLPADHQSDRGVRGIKSTLDILKKNQIPHTGLGMNLDEALEPAYVAIAGLKVAFVSWNEVPGPRHANATTPGVAWMTKANIDAAVGRARAAGADLVICDPQWWGGSEYHADVRNSQVQDLAWMDAAGCDHVLAGGLHLSGAVLLRQHANGVSMVNTGPGNYMFGQGWWQQTQEGVILDLTFRGKALVNLRLVPYVMIDEARASLLDPEADGHYVLQRIWKSSELGYKP